MRNNDQHELFEFITQVSFMLDDITLYLNTHPSCPKGLETYEYYKNLRKDAVADYERLYGPLCKYNVNSDNYYSWVNDPWPWEGECDC